MGSGEGGVDEEVMAKKHQIKVRSAKGRKVAGKKWRRQAKEKLRAGIR